MHFRLCPYPGTNPFVSTLTTSAAAAAAVALELRTTLRICILPNGSWQPAIADRRRTHKCALLVDRAQIPNVFQMGTFFTVDLEHATDLPFLLPALQPNAKHWAMHIPCICNTMPHDDVRCVSGERKVCRRRARKIILSSRTSEHGLAGMDRGKRTRLFAAHLHSYANVRRIRGQRSHRS